MAWKIHSWSARDGRGAIASSHFGPLPFGPAENVDGVADFEVGEEVRAQIDGRSEKDLVVRAVRPARQRQPPETRWPPFDAMSGRFGDAVVKERTADVLQIWFGDCCEHCTPAGLCVRFEGITAIRGLDDDYDFDTALVRLASADEIRQNGLATPEGSTAFCIVCPYASSPESQRVFVVARNARIVPAAKAGG